MFYNALLVLLKRLRNRCVMKVYTPDDYDKFDVLSPPSGLWVILLYGMKYIFLILLPQLPRVGDNMKWLSDSIPLDWSLLFTSLPPLLLLFAWVKRSPKGAGWHRTLWSNGRLLLLLCFGGELSLFLLHVILGESPNEILLVMGYLNIMLLLYIIRANRLRDAFAEFPDPPNLSEPPKSKAVS